MAKVKAAIIGSGNIGTDLMIKIMRTSDVLEMGAMVGIDPSSDGLARAQRLGVATTHEGIEGLQKLPMSGRRSASCSTRLRRARTRRTCDVARPRQGDVDLTPAAIGPLCRSPVNGDDHLDAPNVNMVTCGGQATIPMVAAVRGGAKVHYAEIVASISSKSAGPGTRANIDEFTETTTAQGDRRGRRREEGQGDHHPQPRRAADDHARHGVHACPKGGRGDDPPSIEAMVAEGATPMSPAIASSRKVQFERFGSTTTR
jgi:acetaldehyde dehydrogenase